MSFHSYNFLPDKFIKAYKPKIKIKFQNGLSFAHSVHEILDYVSDYYDFVDSDNPDFIIFGPYGNDIPAKSDSYTRIGYFCENIMPDLSICEWAFGMPREEEIQHPKYKKIQWHNLKPQQLIKPDDFDPDEIISQKDKFCNFLYSHRVPYREEFFKTLSKYKKVDAPGKSMNNMPSIDSLYSGDIWTRKKQFLAPYKFTIAFENYSYPGYQTEKLYDAMQAYSIPVYLGDPYINEIFNTQSFINAFDIVEPKYGPAIKSLEKMSQMNFIDIRPQFYNNISHRIARKVKHWGRELKMSVELNGLNYKKLVDRIVEIDENDKLYKQMLSEPWFNNNQVPSHTSSVNRWIEIFGS